MTRIVSSLGLRGIVTGTLFFASGVVLADRVKHFLGSRGAVTPPPYAHVDYTTEGTFIDKQRYVDGKLGAPRCDWLTIGNDERNEHVRDQLTRDQTSLIGYYQHLSREATEGLVYSALVRLARADATSVDEEAKKLKESYGFRWEIDYKPVGSK